MTEKTNERLEYERRHGEWRVRMLAGLALVGLAWSLRLLIEREEQFEYGQTAWSCVYSDCGHRSLL